MTKKKKDLGCKVKGFGNSLTNSCHNSFQDNKVKVFSDIKVTEDSKQVDYILLDYKYHQIKLVNEIRNEFQFSILNIVTLIKFLESYYSK